MIPQDPWVNRGKKNTILSSRNMPDRLWSTFTTSWKRTILFCNSAKRLETVLTSSGKPLLPQSLRNGRQFSQEFWRLLRPMFLPPKKWSKILGQTLTNVRMNSPAVPSVTNTNTMSRWWSPTWKSLLMKLTCNGVSLRWSVLMFTMSVKKMSPPLAQN